MDKNLYMRYVILLIIGCIGTVASIVVGTYIYIKEDLNEYISFGFITRYNIKRRAARQKKQCVEAKSAQFSNKLEKSLESTGLANDDTTLLNDDTTLLNDEKMNL